ncbi:hypothetical protein Ade02nite_80520 [Paractinoplanes deccanensis]|uniref:Uncharacterized protein n=1 Tax=Paractinoplanes deccanensis TaxID=113561 RepID=A0ABQ3YHD8_9ACTN|nr:hypothetical protein Ade02nite_80520 [Actinoplanes deccanensis]
MWRIRAGWVVLGGSERTWIGALRREGTVHGAGSANAALAQPGDDGADDEKAEGAPDDALDEEVVRLRRWIRRHAASLLDLVGAARLYPAGPGRAKPFDDIPLRQA